MSKTSSKLIFFGSGPVGLASLKSLLDNFEIEAVVTKPAVHARDTMPVIDFARSQSLTLFTPRNQKELAEIFSSKPFVSRLGVVIDYGLIIPTEVIDSFELGIVNSHFSLLPEWRGADPISFALLSGQKKTGVSLMLIEAQMDTGPLLAQTDVEITTDETSDTLTAKLISASNKTLKKILPLYLNHEAQPQNQVEATINGFKSPTYSRKLAKEDGLLDYNKPAAQLEREIRAFITWPKSRTSLAGKDVIITKAKVAENLSLTQGQIDITTDKDIAIGTSLGTLLIQELKPQGKASMSSTAFLAGYGSKLKAA